MAKGVKVDLGIPKELWHKPSAEITHLKSQCETLLEDYEELIENWYFKKQEKILLQDYLWKQNMLKNKSKKCLKETFDEKNKKGDRGEL